jgi:hypothetical protein
MSSTSSRGLAISWQGRRAMYESALPCQEAPEEIASAKGASVDTLRVSRPEDRALRGRNLSAEPEAVMGRAGQRAGPVCRWSITARKQKILGSGEKPQKKKPGVALLFEKALVHLLLLTSSSVSHISAVALGVREERAGASRHEHLRHGFHIHPEAWLVVRRVSC